MTKRRSFVVSGKGSFPMDMLRYDECYPTSADGVANMIAPPHGFFKIKLGTSASWAPTVKRWESFGWTAVEEADRG